VRSIETDNKTKPGDDGMLALATLQDMDDEVEEGAGDPDVDDNDKEEDEDPLDALDDNKREELTNNTEAVCTTLNKVCLSTPLLYCLRAHVRCYYRSTNSPSPLFIPPPLPFLHGTRPVLLILFMFNLSLMMSKHDGILHMIC
jgi:hypothetical protein